MKTRLLITLITLTTIFAEKLYITESSFYRNYFQWLELESHSEYFYDSLGNELYSINIYKDDLSDNGERKEKSIPQPTNSDTIQTTMYQYWDWDNGEWRDSLLSTIVTTKAGAYAGYSHSHPDSSGNWHLFAQGVTHFNEHGNPLVDSSYSFGSKGTTSYDVDSFYYSQDGLCTLSVRFSESGGIRKNIVDIRYTYTTEGKVVDEIRRNWGEDHWYYVVRIETAYQGDTTTLTESRYNQDKWEYNNKTFITRNTKGQITDKIKNLWENENWSLHDHEIFTYNSIGKIESYTFNKGFPNGNRPDYRDLYDYIDDSLPRKHIREYYKKKDETKGMWVTNWETIYTYKTLEQITSIIPSKATKSSKPIHITPKGITIDAPATELHIYSLQGKLLRTIRGVSKGGATYFRTPKELAKAPYVLKLVDEKSVNSIPAFIHHF